MIDELSLGLAPVLVDTLIPSLQEVNRRGTALLLVEQDVRLALESAQYAYVLETGRVALSGPAAPFIDDARVKEAYLGL